MDGASKTGLKQRVGVVALAILSIAAPMCLVPQIALAATVSPVSTSPGVLAATSDYIIWVALAIVIIAVIAIILMVVARRKKNDNDKGGKHAQK